MEITHHQVDVQNENEVSTLLDEIVENFGRVDYCANCAGELYPSDYRQEVTYAERQKGF